MAVPTTTNAMATTTSKTIRSGNTCTAMLKRKENPARTRQWCRAEDSNTRRSFCLIFEVFEDFIDWVQHTCVVSCPVVSHLKTFGLVCLRSNRSSNGTMMRMIVIVTLDDDCYTHTDTQTQTRERKE
mmetsp:Transcript_13867/g.29143  ORF Transcript_13867/g.29143 Transcript_13867/m.29143 type:complete len:127 (-) Transcript_13867:154-534(-)